MSSYLDCSAVLHRDKKNPFGRKKIEHSKELDFLIGSLFKLDAGIFQLFVQPFIFVLDQSSPISNFRILVFISNFESFHQKPNCYIQILFWSVLDREI